MQNLLQLLRPHQWLKNLFIFSPLFFSKEFTSLLLVEKTLWSFIAFCFIASAVYCFNDILDIEADRLHPKKRNRPLVSGAVSKKAGIFLMVTCLVIGFSIFLIAQIAPIVIFLAIFYVLMNIAYSAWLKQKALIDVIVISLGFVIRIFVGGLTTDIWISHWIVLMTFLLALFLAFAKRRDDYLIYNQTGMTVRKNIIGYNFEFLNAALVISATITIVAYIMYAVSSEVINRMGSDKIYVTVLFVLIGILRYLQLTLVYKKTGSPTKILVKDRYIQLCILCWIIAFGFIIYI